MWVLGLQVCGGFGVRYSMIVMEYLPKMKMELLQNANILIHLQFIERDKKSVIHLTWVSTKSSFSTRDPMALLKRMKRGVDRKQYIPALSSSCPGQGRLSASARPPKIYCIIHLGQTIRKTCLQFYSNGPPTLSRPKFTRRTL
jgi:hypothetical protein